MITSLAFNDLLAQETRRNLAAFFARLREQGPLVFVPDFGGMGGAWIVTRYDDAVALLKDPRLTKDARKLLLPEDGQKSAEEYSLRSLLPVEQSMLMVDPPDHTRLRALVSKAFTPRMIEQLRPRIQQIADELLDAVQARGTMDLIADFAVPLPITVISEMLGIPTAVRQQFRTWTQTIVDEQPEQEARMSALKAFLHYIQTLLEEKRRHPGSDLISGLVQAEEHGDMLGENELIATIFLLIIAGHETTVNLIGNGTLALLQHPDQMRLLQHDPTLIASAVEELLRYTSPVSLSDERWATEDISLYGQTIRKGELVYAALTAANTDAQRFHNPEALELTRQENQHLAFGKGIHFCLGAPLARLEGQIALSTLLGRLPDLHLASDPEQLRWTRNHMLRGLTSLPVAF